MRRKVKASLESFLGWEKSEQLCKMSLMSSLPGYGDSDVAWDKVWLHFAHVFLLNSHWYSWVPDALGQWQSTEFPYKESQSSLNYLTEFKELRNMTLKFQVVLFFVSTCTCSQNNLYRRKTRCKKVRKGSFFLKLFWVLVFYCINYILCCGWRRKQPIIWWETRTAGWVC